MSYPSSIINQQIFHLSNKRGGPPAIEWWVAVRFSSQEAIEWSQSDGYSRASSDDGKLIFTPPDPHHERSLEL